jgi:hypothetical protein
VRLAARLASLVFFPRVGNCAIWRKAQIGVENVRAKTAKLALISVPTTRLLCGYLVRAADDIQLDPIVFAKVFACSPVNNVLQSVLLDSADATKSRSNNPSLKRPIGLGGSGSQISLQSSIIQQKFHPIRGSSPVVLGLRQGKGLTNHFHASSSWRR